MDTPKTRSETLRESIEELIAVGKLAPGQHLDETSLAEEFGVSRTPIREALIQLASMGIVEMRPRRGAIVAEIGPQQLIEMFEVMAEFEAMCGRLAARRMTPAEHAELLAAHQACQAARDACDPDAYFYLNEAFHDHIYAGSHNGFLAEQARALHRRLRPYRRLQLRVRDRLKMSYDEHQAVVDAIIAGDPERTVEVLRQHIMIQGQRFADLVASLHQLKSAA
ncbi:MULTISPECIES: GntR family transcriptional regulator [Herbaspirillum]|jgi:DNA-binding GntR family transcriptional regulator|uniref:GntR family transcriptional regulator n=3 Tax=Herbaspirillum TaxID=963 RepID=A0AAJ2HCY7_9BURK|nr:MULTISPECIES: GntR family transcriptional regulator [Herbaspirillum]MBW9332234.1 GntR family transcriptional regulator [Herbaspirillum sp. RU 5E]MDR9836520.1 GntR family transcriptional regulator [Herbaspirillum huttiense]MRT31579.1 GntR family transcriptional regulator [Herbaspirillum sp. CAH-3]OWY36854.1 GntR family transcriptional regulator [Herbaspirillum aquaticum]UWE14390.1 GntR family transcriptional regulator [Herbaspirillum huttiense]